MRPDPALIAFATAKEFSLRSAGSGATFDETFEIFDRSFRSLYEIVSVRVGTMPARLKTLSARRQKTGARGRPGSAARKGAPAVDAAASVTDDYIICLEDGTRHVMMKRHLRSLGLTPKQYIERWNLPADYPMAAPGYSARKKAEAMRSRLGTKENKLGMTVAQLDELEHAAA